jgi:hypothetical protein
MERIVCLVWLVVNVGRERTGRMGAGEIIMPHNQCLIQTTISVLTSSLNFSIRLRSYRYTGRAGILTVGTDVIQDIWATRRMHHFHFTPTTLTFALYKCQC